VRRVAHLAVADWKAGGTAATGEETGATGETAEREGESVAAAGQTAEAVMKEAVEAVEGKEWRRNAPCCSKACVQQCHSNST
tara:strand:+ start:856 stop:1101 length:246 start_codon:yes stop_codon:yes gene_type:complete